MRLFLYGCTSYGISGPRPLLRDLLRHFSCCEFLLSVVLFHLVRQINSILNVRSTSPNDRWHNKYRNEKEKRWHSLNPLWGFPRDAPPPPPESVRTAFARSLAWSYADVITKFSRLDGSPTSITHSASLARFARRSSAINYNAMINAIPSCAKSASSKIK